MRAHTRGRGRRAVDLRERSGRETKREPASGRGRTRARRRAAVTAATIVVLAGMTTFAGRLQQPISPIPPAATPGMVPGPSVPPVGATGDSACFRQQAPTFRSGVEVVAIDVSVVDRTGQPVGDLKPSDFVVQVDRKPRTILSAQFVRYELSTAAERAKLDPAKAAAAARGVPAEATARIILIVFDDVSGVRDRHQDPVVPPRRRRRRPPGARRGRLRRRRARGRSRHLASCHGPRAKEFPSVG